MTGKGLLATPLSAPFPVASGRYEVGPGMRRFGQPGQGMDAEEGHFQPDARLAETLAAKLAVLRRAPREAHLVAAGLTPEQEAGLREAIRETFRLLAAEHPAMATIEEDGVALHHLGLRLRDWTASTPRLEAIGEGWPELQPVAREVREWLAEQEGFFRLGNALGLAVQEDLAIVRGPDAAGQSQGAPSEPGGARRTADAGGAPGGEPGADVLEWTHVCLPSSWAPSEKIGRSFAAVHRPVVHSERLVNAHRQLVRAMIHGGPFVRYVWGICSDPALCHNPRLHQTPPWPADAPPEELARRAYFRVERQTTRGFPGLNRALFTIRYWVEPLPEAVADPWRKERLASALAGMDAEELAYKGLTDARGRLVGWLRAQS